MVVRVQFHILQTVFLAIKKNEECLRYFQNGGRFLCDDVDIGVRAGTNIRCE